MIRLALAGAAAMSLLFGLPACSSSPDCAGQSSIDQGVAAGQPTSRTALDALLSEHPKWVNQDGWTIGSTASKPDQSVTYVAGGDNVKVVRSAQNGRWYLDSWKGCR
jgi:hypothetical protein